MLSTAGEPTACWERFIERLPGAALTDGLVKFQTVGPFTHRATGRDRFPTAELGARLDRIVDLGIDPLLVLDEPPLMAADPAAFENMVDPLRSLAPAWGLHVCGPVPWYLVERVRPDYLSFDISVESIDEGGIEALRALLDSGTHVAWGAVPTDRFEPVEGAIRRLGAILERLPGAERQSLLTPACGTGLLGIDREIQIVEDLRRIRAALLNL